MDRAIIQVKIGLPKTPAPRAPKGISPIEYRKILQEWFDKHLKTHPELTKVRSLFQDAGIEISEPTGAGNFIAFCSEARAKEIVFSFPFKGVQVVADGPLEIIK